MLNWYCLAIGFGLNFNFVLYYKHILIYYFLQNEYCRQPGGLKLTTMAIKWSIFQFFCLNLVYYKATEAYVWVEKGFTTGMFLMQGFKCYERSTIITDDSIIFLFTIYYMH